MSSTMASRRSDAESSGRATLVLPPLRPYQRKLVNHPAHELVIVSATQIGKSYGCAAWILGEMFEQPGVLAWWTGPTYIQTEIGFEFVERFARAAGLLWWSRPGRLRLGLRNGAWMDCRSWKYEDNLLGPSVGPMVVDEAGQLTPKVRSILASRRSATGGRARYIGNPTHNRSEFYRLVKQAEQQKDPKRMALLTWTWRDYERVLGKDARKEYLQFVGIQKEDELERDYERLYEAKFGDVGEHVLDLRPVCVNGGTEERPVKLPFREEIEKDERCVMGLDLAQKQDYMVASVFSRTTGRLKAMERYRHQPWEVQVNRAASLARETSQACFVDATGIGGPVREMLVQALSNLTEPGTELRLVPITFTGQKKQSVFQALQVAVQKKRVSMPWIREAVSECDTLEYKPKAGHMGYEAQSGFHDDVPVSMALAVYGMSRVVEGVPV